jgi:hypothetical protein
MSEPIPRRRWFRFSLRTLFVLVAVGCTIVGFAAYNLNWIRQRHALTIDGNVEILCSTVETPSAPWALKLLGETGARVVRVYGEGNKARATQAFPEAAILVQPESP